MKLKDLSDFLNEKYTSEYEPPEYVVKPHKSDVLFKMIKQYSKNNMKDKKHIKVFLGGTCNNSTWRDELIKLLKIDYFNPVVDDWTEEAQIEEKHQRKVCDYVLYVITPKMTGVYSIAEVIDDSNKRPEKTLFCFLEDDGSIKFEIAQIKSLKAVYDLVEENGGTCFKSIKNIANFLNNINY